MDRSVSDAADVGERVLTPCNSTASSLSDGGGGDRVKAELSSSFRRWASSPQSLGSEGSDSSAVVQASLEHEFRQVLSEREIDVLGPGHRSISIAPRNFDDDATDDASSLLDDDDSSSYVVGRSGSYGSQRSTHETTCLFPMDVISELQAIASRMAAAGYVSECVQAYASVRKAAVESALRLLGVVDKIGIDDVQWLDWDELETQIRRWIRAARAVVRGVFASERRLCFLVFHDIRLISPTTTAAHEAAFAGAVTEPALQLLAFAEAVSTGRPSPEKLFKIIDMHDRLADLLPDISDTFAASKATESVYAQAAAVRSSLADAVRRTLSEFESAVVRDPSKTALPRGTVHPLTRYVMNYNNLTCHYKTRLSEMITSSRPSSGILLAADDDQATPPPAAAFPEPILGPDDDSTSSQLLPFAIRLVQIIDALEQNLESKASLYQDPALPHLFLMNNVRYIVHKVRDSSELKELIGDGYLKRLTCKYKQAATGYQRSGWFEILNHLRDEGTRVGTSFSWGISKLVLRERFKGFNAAFGEAHKVQSGWYVPDTRLREELRASPRDVLKDILN